LAKTGKKGKNVKMVETGKMYHVKKTTRPKPWEQHTREQGTNAPNNETLYNKSSEYSGVFTGNSQSQNDGTVLPNLTASLITESFTFYQDSLNSSGVILSNLNIGTNS
jgi:hypothetical protein